MIVQSNRIRLAAPMTARRPGSKPCSTRSTTAFCCSGPICGQAPHVTQRAVAHAGPQVGPKQQNAVVDGVEHGLLRGRRGLFGAAGRIRFDGTTIY